MNIVINAVFLRSEKLGGSFIYTHRLVQELARTGKGDAITVLCPREVADRFEGEGILPRIVDIPAHSKVARVLAEQSLIPRIVRELRPDILHSTGNVTPWRTGCASVVTLHDLQYRHYPEYFPLLRRLYLRRAVPRSLRRADAVVFDSHSTMNDALRAYHAPLGISRVVHLGGLDDSESVRTPDTEAVRRRYDIDAPFILSVGSALPHKNLPLLIEAFRAVSQSISQDLLLVGEPFEHGSQLDRLIDSASGPEGRRIRRLGFVPRQDLIALYNASDVFVFPSLFEGFGIPVVEAMQCGCPVVASHIDVHREIGGEAVAFFDPGNGRSLANVLKEVCTNPQVRRALHEKGPRQGAQFSWKKMASHIRDLYDEVLATRSARSQMNG